MTSFPDIRYKTLQSCKGCVTIGQLTNRTGGGYMLQKVLEDAAVAIEKGQADPSIIKDIVAYAQYRIQSSGG